MAKFGETERFIIDLFRTKGTFEYLGIAYNILKIGKPRPASGECKTDIYILAKTASDEIKEFKISIKQDNADFLENKINLIRAKQILGNEAEAIILRSLAAINLKFQEDYLINIDQYKRTEPNCIKIGWKFELLNKIGGEKSALLNLSNEQKIDVFSGTNLSLDKINSRVNGEIIQNSGIANFLLECNVDAKVNDVNYYSHKLVNIDEYAVAQNIYFACKAVNYRVDSDKWDGNRPLSVFCNWEINKSNPLCI